MKELILIISILFLVYIIIENKIMLNIRCESFNANKDKLKIIHLSDLHKRQFQKNNSRLINKVKAQKPDLIIFSGDLISRDCRDFTSIFHLMNSLNNIAPVFYSFGNHEIDIPVSYQNQLETTLTQEYGVNVLNNKSFLFQCKGRIFNISGISLKSSFYKNSTGKKYRNLEKYTLEKLVNTMGKLPKDEDITNILIAHNPLFAEVYAEWGADYTFSGHVHGGIIRIPFLKKALLSPERTFFPKYAKGVYYINQMKHLVSAGLGKLRLFNPPEIVVYYI